jgi:DNA invertase Pin-like site-specific DNA recombinase
MNSCALYLRYSSDRQNERSPEDQEAVCRPYMERLGFAVVAVYVDRAKSGASVHERTDFQRMLADAKRGLFQAVCAETTSRYGRDEEDRAAARKRLTFHGVAIYTANTGLVSRLYDGITAVMDAHQLEDLKLMIRRGMAGVVRSGRFAGGAIYGYRSVAKLPGEPKGDLEIDPAEAAIVRRIFREYVAGATCRAIAARLNAEGVPAPRKEFWRASTINGHSRRKTGILQNELYCGRLIWNRAKRVRDPDSSQRVWRYNPESEWHRCDAPQLRIVDEALFETAQRRRAERARARGWQVRPKRLLSGLLRCGACGAGMAKKDVDHGRPRIVCTRMIEASACSNRRRYYLDDIEHRVIGGLRAQLGSPDAIAYFVECYNDERRRRVRGNTASRRARLESDLAAIESQIKRAVAAILDGRISEAEAAEHLPRLRQRQSDLSASLRDLTAQPVALDRRSGSIAAYLRELALLEERGGGDSEAGRLIRQMLKAVVIEPAPAGEPPIIGVRGELGPLLGFECAHVGGSSGAG